MNSGSLGQFGTRGLQIKEKGDVCGNANGFMIILNPPNVILAKILLKYTKTLPKRIYFCFICKV